MVYRKKTFNTCLDNEPKFKKRPFSAKKCLANLTWNGFFQREVPYLFEGDPYRNPSQNMRSLEKDAHKKIGHEHTFRPARSAANHKFKSPYSHHAEF